MKNVNVLAKVTLLTTFLILGAQAHALVLTPLFLGACALTSGCTDKLGRSPGAVVVACAPATQQTNIAITTDELNRLASGKFQSNPKFNEVVQKIALLQDGEKNGRLR